MHVTGDELHSALHSVQVCPSAPKYSQCSVRRQTTQMNVNASATQKSHTEQLKALYIHNVFNMLSRWKPVYWQPLSEMHALFNWFCFSFGRVDATDLIRIRHFPAFGLMILKIGDGLFLASSLCADATIILWIKSDKGWSEDEIMDELSCLFDIAWSYVWVRDHTFEDKGVWHLPPRFASRMGIMNTRLYPEWQ